MTLDELYAEAKRDLTLGGHDVALKWAFRHAQAQGRYAAYLRRLERAERTEREMLDRTMGPFPPDDTARARIMSLMPTPQELAELRELLEDATAWVRFTELVLSMFNGGKAA